MLQVTHQTRRALSSAYICTSCLVQFANRACASTGNRRSKSKPKNPLTKGEKSELWRQTLDALKQLQGRQSHPAGQSPALDIESSGDAPQSPKPGSRASRSSSKASGARAQPMKNKGSAIPPRGQRSIKAQLQAVANLSQNVVDALRDVVAMQLDRPGRLEVPGRVKNGRPKESRSARPSSAGKRDGGKRKPSTPDGEVEGKNINQDGLMEASQTGSNGTTVEEQEIAVSSIAVLELHKGAEVTGDKMITSRAGSASGLEKGKKIKKKRSSKKKGERGEKKRSKTAERFTVQSINSAELELTPVEREQPPVPGLQYGLDRVLFNPGVYHLQDPRSRVFNFDPYLAAIMPIQEFDFTALKQYVTSSKDHTLISIAAEHQKRYTGSTSSMGTMLTQFHYLLSSWRRINPAYLSQNFRPESYNFTRINRAPAATFLHWKNGTYAIDADKQFDSANILSMLGRSMEKLLTIPRDEFEKYRKDNSDQLTDDERNGPESFHYTTMGDFLMRSQLDAYDPRVVGSGMFDLKTRAVVSIRMDARGFEKGLGYEIRGRFGQWESFEREYFDMIRSAFLKYSLQVRMGRMDGIFVAFHNTQRIFGFQYIPIPEMDVALHGTDDTTLGDREFRLSLHLLNQALDRATAKFPGRSLRLHFETRETDPPFMYIFAKPVDQGEIDEVQNAGKAQIEAFERGFLGLGPKAEMSSAGEARIPDGGDGSPEDIDAKQNQDREAEEKEEEQEEEEAEEEEEEEEDPETSLETWEDMMDKVEDTLTNDEQGIMSIREAIEDALDQSGLLRAEKPEESRRYLEALLEAVTSAARASAEEKVGELGHETEQGPRETPRLSRPVETAEGSSLSTPSTSESLDSSQITQSVSGADGFEKDTTEEALVLNDAVDSDKHSPTEMPDSAEVEPEFESGARYPTDETSDADEDTAEGDRDSHEASSEEPSLKDLIIRLAEQLKAAPAEERLRIEGPESRPDDYPSSDDKLHKFIVILSEMMDKSRALDSQHEGKNMEDSAVVDDTSIDAVAQTEGGEEAGPSSSVGDESRLTEAIPLDPEGDEIYGMILTIKNKVNGKYVVRPVDLKPDDLWEVEYAFEDIAASRCDKLYNRLLARRMSLMKKDDDTDDNWYKMFSGKLHEYSSKGRAFREKENERQRSRPIHIYGTPQPLQWDSVFRK